MKNLLVAQSGGPTSAINATIAGVIMEAHASDQVDTIYGAVNGIKGVLEERFVNLSEKVPGEDELEILCQTPAAALGSCRVKLKNPAEDDSQFQEIIRIFRQLAEEFGKTVIVVTHSETVSQFSDERVLLENGQLRRLSPAAEAITA